MTEPRILVSPVNCPFFHSIHSYKYFFSFETSDGNTTTYQSHSVPEKSVLQLLERRRFRSCETIEPQLFLLFSILPLS